jgi:hypothetical protein
MIFSENRCPLFGINALTSPPRIEPPEDRFGADIGLLALNAPIFEFFERDRRSRHGATHIGAWPNHPKIPIQKLHLRFAWRMVVEAVEHRVPPWMGRRAAAMATQKHQDNAMMAAVKAGSEDSD